MKRLPFNDKIKEKMTAALGSADFKPEDFAFFETIMINDLPISKMGSIYDGSRMTKATLDDMVAHIKKEGFLPIQVLHNSGELPKGRVIDAESNQSISAKGAPVNEIRALFYIPLNTPEGATLAANVDNGIINEVSIGARAQHLMCSGVGGEPCNFDYMGANTFMNWLDQTCSNDHTIGKDGTHAIFDGLKKFYELSLVSQGAADHARIVNPSQAITAANDDSGNYQLLYATKGKEKDTVMKLTAAQIAELKASFEKDGKRAIDAKFAGVTGCLSLLKDDMTMADAEAARVLFKTELAAFVAANPETTPEPKVESANLSVAEVIDLKADVKIATNKITELQAALTAKDAIVATLTQENATLKATKIQLDAMTAEVTPVKEFLKLSCQNLMVASGVTNPTVPESLAELVATIKTAQAKLSKLPTGGLLLSTETGSGKTGDGTTARDLSAFKVRKD